MRIKVEDTISLAGVEPTKEKENLHSYIIII
jgi:hypothetical protein